MSYNFIIVTCVVRISKVSRWWKHIKEPNMINIITIITIKNHKQHCLYYSCEICQITFTKLEDFNIHNILHMTRPTVWYMQSHLAYILEIKRNITRTISRNLKKIETILKYNVLLALAWKDNLDLCQLREGFKKKKSGIFQIWSDPPTPPL